MIVRMVSTENVDVTRVAACLLFFENYMVIIFHLSGDNYMENKANL